MKCLIVKPMKYSLKIIITTILFLLNSEVYSCSCVSEKIESQIKNAEIIIQGILIKAEYHESSDFLQQKEYTFDVNRSYKGAVSDQLSVYTPIHGSACGVNLSVGMKYVVLVSENKQIWSCQGHEEWYPIEHEERRDDLNNSGLLKELRNTYKESKKNE